MMLPSQMKLLDCNDARDQKELAQRYADLPLRAVKPQLPADHGLFSDESNQLDLMNMFQDGFS